MTDSRRKQIIELAKGSRLEGESKLTKDEQHFYKIIKNLIKKGFVV